MGNIDNCSYFKIGAIIYEVLVFFHVYFARGMLTLFRYPQNIVADIVTNIC